MVSRVSVAAIAVLLLASAACTGGEEENAPASPTSSTAETAAPTSGPATTPSPVPSVPVDWRAYTDPIYGYSFDYPANWYLSPPKDNAGQLILYSYDLAVVPPEEAGMPVPKDKLKAFFWVAEGVNKPIDQWLAEERARASAEQNLPPPTVISQSPTELADREGLVELIESDGTKSITYYIPLGSERVFVVNAIPADSQVWPEFEELLTTVRFAA